MRTPQKMEEGSSSFPPSPKVLTSVTLCLILGLWVAYFFLPLREGVGSRWSSCADPQCQPVNEAMGYLRPLPGSQFMYLQK